MTDTAAPHIVCLECGVDVAQSRTRGWVHTAEIPKAVKAHDAQPVRQEDYEKVLFTSSILTPLNEAKEYARKIQEQMQREEMQGVRWDDAARHSVVLLVALEAAEQELLKRPPT